MVGTALTRLCPPSTLLHAATIQTPSPTATPHIPSPPPHRTWRVRGAAAVAGDDAGLLALDVGIDAGHPGIDLVRTAALAERLDVIGPGSTPSGVASSRVSFVLHRERMSRDPVDAVFDAARNIAERGVRPHQHQHDRKFVDHDAR